VSDTLPAIPGDLFALAHRQRAPRAKNQAPHEQGALAISGDNSGVAT
jgi:hypothetical protein